MPKRISIVNTTRVASIALSSVFQIGDSTQITQRSQALAVQRQRQFFYGREGNLNAFTIFTTEIPKLDPIEDIVVQRYNHVSFIKVDRINIKSVSAASVYHIGSTTNIDAETRIKHIRQLESAAD